MKFYLITFFISLIFLSCNNEKNQTIKKTPHPTNTSPIIKIPNIIDSTLFLGFKSNMTDNDFNKQILQETINGKLKDNEFKINYKFPNDEISLSLKISKYRNGIKLKIMPLFETYKKSNIFINTQSFDSYRKASVKYWSYDSCVTRIINQLSNNQKIINTNNIKELKLILDLNETKYYFFQNEFKTTIFGYTYHNEVYNNVNTTYDFLDRFTKEKNINKKDFESAK